MIKKRFKFLISHRLPNGVIISEEFCTEMEDSEKSGDVLFDEVYTSTMDDFKRLKEKNKLVKVLWDSLCSGVKLQQNISNAEKEFDAN